MVAAHSFLLLTVFQEFVRFSNKDIEQIIKKEMSGDVKNSFYAIGNKCLTIATFYYCGDGGASADRALFTLQSAALRTNPLILRTAYTKP